MVLSSAGTVQPPGSCSCSCCCCVVLEVWRTANELATQTAGMPALLQGGEDMEMDDASAGEQQPRGPVIDEDGFQVVQRKGRGGRR